MHRSRLPSLYAKPYTLNPSGGQSLIEILIGIAIGTVLIGGAVGALVVTLRSGSQGKNLRVASALNQELLEKLPVYAETKWQQFFDLAEAPAEWFLATSTNSFIAQSGRETISVDGVSYERYFTSEIVQPEDFSLRLVRAIVSWPEGETQEILSRPQYLARISNRVWQSASPGNGGESPVFDSGSANSGLNTIMWQGTGGSVGFRVASSNSASGPWAYLGPDSDPAAYYQPAGSNLQTQISAADHNNKRYFRYQIFYLSGTPKVEEVIINYSP